MAMVKCAECGKEVSDKATTCPSCGAPIAGVQETGQEKEFSVRQGAITGLIGCIGFLVVIVVFAMMYLSGTTESTGHALADVENMIARQEAFEEFAAGGWVAVAPLVAGLVVATIGFVIAVALANRLGRPQSIGLSVVCLSGSLAVLLWLGIFWNVWLVCMAWLIGWQPALMVYGSARMLKSSLRMPK